MNKISEVENMSAAADLPINKCKYKSNANAHGIVREIVKFPGSPAQTPQALAY